ncbi:MAG: hypothetical protein ACOCUV_03405 [bacterium]
MAIMERLGFRDTEIIFIELLDSGARIRLGANTYKPGDSYEWFNMCKKEKSDSVLEDE